MSTRPYEPEDRITLWDRVCGGRALVVKPYWLEGNSSLMAEDVSPPATDQEPIVCRSCGRSLGGYDFGRTVVPVLRIEGDKRTPVPDRTVD